MPEEAFTKEDLELAADDLEMLEFYKTSMRASAMTYLRTICPHKRALKWLVAELVNHVGRWPGSAEVRGLLCTRFDPPDGKDQPCTLPGHSPDEAEARYIESHQQRISKGQAQITDAETVEMLRKLNSKVRSIQ